MGFCSSELGMIFTHEEHAKKTSLCTCTMQMDIQDRSSTSREPKTQRKSLNEYFKKIEKIDFAFSFLLGRKNRNRE